MRKFLSILVFLSMICTLVACGDSGLDRFHGKWRPDMDEFMREIGADPEDRKHRVFVETVIKQEGLDTFLVAIDAPKKTMTITFRDDTWIRPVAAVFHGEGKGFLIDTKKQKEVFSFTFTGEDTLVLSGWSEDNDFIFMRRDGE